MRLTIALVALLGISSPAHADTQQAGVICSVNQHGPSSSYGQNGWTTITFNYATCTTALANVSLWICGTGATGCSGGPLFGDVQQARLVKTLLDAMASGQTVDVGYTTAQVLKFAAVTVNGGTQAP
jgi:hypothetical protein